MLTLTRTLMRVIVTSGPETNVTKQGSVQEQSDSGTAMATEAVR